MTTIIDVAGAHQGGAARFLSELDRYLETSHDDIQVLGRGSGLTAAWLGWREYLARSADNVVATNNVSFVAGSGERTVLLRNALHFLTQAEVAGGLRRPRSVIAQTPVIRAAARRADRIVVPCAAMGDRVTTVSPRLAGRVSVRHHPVSQSGRRTRTVSESAFLLAPVLFAGYKAMDQHINSLLAALSLTSSPLQVHLTASASEVPPHIAADPRITLLGRLPASELIDQWRSCTAAFFPTGTESFGYPLAEARVNGIPVIAQATEQNREIAGRALCGFALNDIASLSAAVEMAATRPVTPDARPFDPTRYFDFLLQRVAA